MKQRLTLANSVPYLLVLFTIAMIGMFAVVKYHQAVIAAYDTGIGIPIALGVLLTAGFDGLFLTFSFILLRNAQVNNRLAAGFAILSIGFMCYANGFISEAGIESMVRIDRYMTIGAGVVVLAALNFAFTMTGKGRKIDDGPLFDEDNIKFNRYNQGREKW